MKRVWRSILAKANTFFTFALALLIAGGLGLAGAAYASDTSNFQITVNAGTLAVDIVDGAFATVASPTVVFGAVTFDFSCQTPGASGTFGTASEQIYVSNPDATAGAWTVSLAGSATTAVWTSAGTDIDFNDPTTGGCTDSGDTDLVAGQLTIDPSGGALAVGQCNSCVTTNVSLGSSNAFEEGVTDSITVVSALAASDDIGDWTVQTVAATQTIPAEQPAAADYDINMVLTIA